MKQLTLCITDSTDGIGLAAAKRFATAGNRVIVHGRITFEIPGCMPGYFPGHGH